VTREPARKSVQGYTTARSRRREVYEVESEAGEDMVAGQVISGGPGASGVPVAREGIKWVPTHNGEKREEVYPERREDVVARSGDTRSPISPSRPGYGSNTSIPPRKAE
jgi:hypothetical protein